MCSGEVVEAEVLPRVDSAQPRLLRRFGEAGEVPRRVRQRLGGYIQGDLIAERKPQYLGRGKTDRAVCARVGGVGSCLRWKRNPCRILRGVGIVVGRRQLNGSDRPPEIVGVFGVKEGDCGVGEADVQQSKQVRALRQIEVMRQSCGLCDLIPEVLNVAVPELTDLGLIRSTSRARDKSKTFDFVE